MSTLAQAAIFLAAAVIAVPLFRHFRLGAVLGYLTAGVVIGPWGLGLIRAVESTMHFAELGVVLLLFVIGLELQPSRLWVLRKPVFGLGSAQVFITALILGAIGLALGLTGAAALVVGFGLAMSSTAFVLQVLAERNQLTTRHGRSAFAILLFQDLSVIPLLALLPMLGTPESSANPWLSVLRAIVVIALLIGGGRYLLRPIFRVIASSRVPEIFTTATLLTVIGTALLMTSAGLSMSLGAFLAGVLLADSEFRHELEADIEPFKGLLLGLFFITVGMSADLGLLRDHPIAIVAATLGLMLIKAIVVFVIGRMSRYSHDSARGLSVALAQGGEFAFVLFNVAAGERIIDANLAHSLTIVVTLSMALTPVIFMLNDWWERTRKHAAEPEFDQIDAVEPHVIIAGFGRVGAVLGRVLRARRISFTALDANAQQVDLVRRFGARAYYGDASRLDLLTAAGAASASLLVLAMDDVEASLKAAELARKHFPHLTILARARNRFHAYRLMDLGVEKISRETFLSTLELAEWTLQAAGLSAWQAQQLIHRFKIHDEQLLERQHAVYHDESQLIQTTKEAFQEMQVLLESDREEATALEGGAVFSPSDVR